MKIYFSFVLSINRSNLLQFWILKEKQYAMQRIFSVYFILFISIITFTSCENEDFDDNIRVENPANLIAQNTDLYGFIDGIVNDDPFLEEAICIDFVYPFTVSIYDELGTQISSFVVGGDNSFSAALARIEEGQLLGMSFPISATLEDGSTFEVNDKEELKASLDACIDSYEETIIGSGESLFLQCVWEVQIPDGAESNTYVNEVFDVSGVGEVDFFYRGIEYDGNWIMYFIENELHLNINLNDTTQVGTDWNFDWKLELVDNGVMRIFETASEQEFLLMKECDEANYCKTLEFESCELTGMPGTAEFILEEYIPCIEIIAAPQEETTFVYSFFNDPTDAQTNENSINPSLPYTNTTNPEVLFVRIEDPAFNTYEVVEISLVAKECED